MKTLICPKCKFQIETKKKEMFCTKCGTKMTTRFCLACGRELKLDDAFCTKCGAKRDAKESPDMQIKIVMIILCLLLPSAILKACR